MCANIFLARTFEEIATLQNLLVFLTLLGPIHKLI